MRVFFSLLLLPALSVLADESQDLAAIGRLVTSLNRAIAGSAIQTAAPLFESSSAEEFERFTGDRRAWSETTPPFLTVRSVRFASQDVAIVDAESVQFGSVVGRASTPALIVLIRKNSEWRIASLRALRIAGSVLNEPIMRRLSDLP